MKSVLLYASLIGAGILLVWWLSTVFPGRLDDGFAMQDMVYLLALLALIGPGAFYGFKNNIGGAFKSIVAWGALLALAVVAYALRDDANAIWVKVKAELLPASATLSANGEVELIRGSNGHFHVDAIVNGQKVGFMVDTGASRVSLSHADAERAGIDTSGLDYTKPVSTANGMAMNANVTLSYVAIGPLRVENVRASVAKDGQMDGSLLGLSFLDGLGGYRVEGDTLILWQ